MEELVSENGAFARSDQRILSVRQDSIDNDSGKVTKRLYGETGVDSEVYNSDGEQIGWSGGAYKMIQEQERLQFDLFDKGLELIDTAAKRVGQAAYNDLEANNPELPEKIQERLQIALGDKYATTKVS